MLLTAWHLLEHKHRFHMYLYIFIFFSFVSLFVLCQFQELFGLILAVDPPNQRLFSQTNISSILLLIPCVFNQRWQNKWPLDSMCHAEITFHLMIEPVTKKWHFWNMIIVGNLNGLYRNSYYTNTISFNRHILFMN